MVYVAFATVPELTLLNPVLQNHETSRRVEILKSIKATGAPRWLSR